MKNYSGLSTQEAQTLLDKFGPNILPAKAGISALKLFISQFNNLLVLILFAAAVLSFFIGEKVDGILIFAILLFNAALGFYQEFKASKEIESLRKLEVANVRVVRDGKESIMSAQFLVPGDLVKVEAGDKIPADARMVESFDLYVNEAPLTGESLPVLKTTKEGEDQVFLGSNVTAGRGLIQITQTGQSTRLGSLAVKLATIEDEKTPLEKSVQALARVLAVVAIFFALAILALHIYHQESFFDAFFLSVSIAVAAVPEGLPVITTILLAIGASNLYRKRTLVRKMVAIENLGAINLICTDKTGTITKNEMRVAEVQVKDKREKDLIDCAVLCNNATLAIKDGGFDILGDTTEGALLIWAQQDKGVEVEQLRSLGKMVDEEPFNLATRLMKVVWLKDGKKSQFIKGAPEKVLEVAKLTDKEMLEWEKSYEQMTKKGLRVLGFVKDGEFLGLVGIADPPREEVKEAISKARSAGVKSVMITGDNELTASYIAKQVGLLQEGDEVLTGAQLEQLSDQELISKLDKVSVFARCVPEHKLRIVSLYQQVGNVVGVTGDGVNDSLALKKAEVGVAMGRIGTDVAKEASDIVIMDDKYSTIVDAIEEGRVVYSNILKVAKFLIAGNLSEVVVVLLAGILFLPTPLVPVQILWINLVTDGILALSLAYDHEGKLLMKSPPRKLNSSFFNRETYLKIFIGGTVIAMLTFAMYMVGLQSSGVELARAMAFTSNVILQIGLMLYIRRKSSLTSNRYLIIAILTVVTAQVLILLVPQLRQIFKIG